MALLRRLYATLVVIAACGGDASPGGPTCSDPPRGPTFSSFVDATPQSGIDFEYTTSAFQGGGLAVVDLDGDARPEIIAGRRDGGLAIYRNEGELHFTELVTGIPSTTAARAIGAADLDNDGDVDLVLATAAVAHVYENQGDATFVDAGPLVDNGTTEHVLPVDLDGDGLLDLYVSNYDVRRSADSENRVYMNLGGLRFSAGVPAGRGLTWTATAFDADDDGDQDLYVANDTLVMDFGGGDPGRGPWPVDLLLRNDGPDDEGRVTLTDVAEQAGLATSRSSMGGVLADFDRDGRLDLFVPDYGKKDLLIGDMTRGFVERAAELGVAATARRGEDCGPNPTSYVCLLLSWSAAVSDFDLDGNDEVLIVNGDTIPGQTPPVVLLTRGADAFHELAPSIACTSGRALVTSDLDGDGDQDVIIAPANGPLALYENRQRSTGHWLGVRLHGRTSNRDGIGARIEITTASGRVLPRAIGAGGVVHTALPAEAHVGLGKDTVESLVVRWPSGRRSELVRPALDRVIVVDEP